jgi:hypothetical protein
MPHASRLKPLAVLAPLAVVAVGVSGCAGSDQPVAAETAGYQSVRTVRTPVEPPPPPTAVTVVDGDTAKPVVGARVVARAGQAVSLRGGKAALGVPRRQMSVDVSARGYTARTVRLDFKKRLTHRVQLWRPALQWPMYGANAARTQVQSGIKVRPPFRTVWKRKASGLMEFPAAGRGAPPRRAGARGAPA